MALQLDEQMRKEHDSLVDRDRIYRRIMRTRGIPIALSFVLIILGATISSFVGAQTTLGSLIADSGVIGFFALLIGGTIYSNRREKTAGQYKLNGEESVFLHVYRALDFLERYTKKGLPEWKSELNKELGQAAYGIANWRVGGLSITSDLDKALDRLFEGFQRSILPAPVKGNNDQIASVQGWLRRLAEYLLDPTPQGLSTLNDSLAKLAAWPPNGVTTLMKLEKWFVNRTWVRYPIAFVLGTIAATVVFEIATADLGATPVEALTPAVTGFVGVMGIVAATPWLVRH